MTPVLAGSINRTPTGPHPGAICSLGLRTILVASPSKLWPEDLGNSLSSPDTKRSSSIKFVFGQQPVKGQVYV